MILTMWGCSENEVLETADDGLPRTIEFSTYVRQSTRATEMTLSELKSQGFGVFAYTSDGGTSPYINNVQVTGKDDGSWASIKTYYWPSSSSTTVDFYAYAPYSSSMEMDATNKTIEYSVNADITQQEDLLYASNVTRNERKVTFTFGHALACVGFQLVKGTNYLPEDDKFSIQITELSISGKFATQNSFNLSTGTWETATPSKTLTFAPASFTAEPFNATLPVMADNENIMLIPGTAENVTITFKYKIRVKVVEADYTMDFGEEQTFSKTYQTKTFEKGVKYIYQFTIDLTEIDMSESEIVFTTDMSKVDAVKETTVS
jgi:hypothetical protein